MSDRSWSTGHKLLSVYLFPIGMFFLGVVYGRHEHAWSGMRQEALPDGARFGVVISGPICFSGGSDLNSMHAYWRPRKDGSCHESDAP